MQKRVVVVVSTLTALMIAGALAIFIGRTTGAETTTKAAAKTEAEAGADAGQAASLDWLAVAYRGRMYDPAGDMFGDDDGPQTGQHGCGVRVGGSLWCWGRNDSGQLGDGTKVDRYRPVRVGTATDWTDVAPGDEHTCGLRADRTLWCWGDNSKGQLGDNTVAKHLVPEKIPGPATWISLRADGRHTCGLRRSAGDASPAAVTLWCWGNIPGVPTRLVGTGWAKVDLGEEFGCGTRVDGSLWCWGDNSAGQLGTGSRTGDVHGRSADAHLPADSSSRQLEVDAGPGRGWTDVATGESHACATRSDATLWCWGVNAYGGLGDGSDDGRLGPVRVPGTGWRHPSAGGDHTCASQADSSLWCWGRAVANGQVVQRNTPSAVPGVKGIATSGAGVTCVLAAETSAGSGGPVYCWGLNGYLGGGSNFDSTIYPRPVALSPGRTWRQVSVAGWATCGIDTAGALWCRGSNADGQVGVGSKWIKPQFVRVSPGSTWSSVSVGAGHTCATKTGGALFCWGSSYSGQLGDSAMKNHLGSPDLLNRPPHRVGTASWSTVTAGPSSTCAIRTDSSLWCWGDSDFGPPPPGAHLKVHTTPVRIGTGHGWNQVSVGEEFACATRTNATLWCWGEGGSYQLGQSDSRNRTNPTQVAGADWAHVEAAGLHACATRRNGTAWCWGSGIHGELGNGTTGEGGSLDGLSLPKLGRLGTVTNWRSLMVGYSHTCGSRTDGSLWCWGDSGRGQTGSATTTGTSQADSVQTLPKRIAPGAAGPTAQWRAASTGDRDTCALRADRTAWCWGDNTYAQISGQVRMVALAPDLSTLAPSPAP